MPIDYGYAKEDDPAYAEIAKAQREAASQNAKDSEASTDEPIQYQEMTEEELEMPGYYPPPPLGTTKK